MSSSNRWNLKNIFIAKAGCGCGPKATDIIEPKPKSKTPSDLKPTNFPPSSASSGDRHGKQQSIADGEEGYTSTSSSLNIGTSPKYCSGNEQDCPKIRNSFAIVKDSDDPYHDFRQSMLQMIFEKELYTKNDLQQLLQCLLQLNPPHHHELIVRAFMEICNGGVSGSEEEAPPFCSG